MESSVTFDPRGRPQRPAPVPRADSATLPLYVEASPLLGRHLTGIGRLVARLVEALARLQPIRLFTTIQGEYVRSMKLSNALSCGQELEVKSGHQPSPDADLQTWARRLFHRSPRPLQAELAEQCGALYTLLRPPMRRFRREVGMIYDFTPMIVPKMHIRETRLQFGHLFAQDARLCDKLVAISQSTKSDARWLCNVVEDKVVVGCPGPSLCVHEHAHPRPVERRANVILVVSTLEPRKNGEFLLTWFLNTRVLEPETELWWVGPPGWLFRADARALRHCPRREKLRFLGIVSDSRLCELYRQATFTIYPSLYEGFGFPVLDSLRHQTPVLCSFNSSLGEFAGPGVHYFDAGDLVSLDNACRELLSAGATTIDRGDLERRYRWDRLARRIVTLLAEPAEHEPARAQWISAA